MTTPSSTSQSVLVEPRGISKSSFGADDGRCRLHEDDWLGWDLGAGFSRVIGIVEADADELAGSGNARAETLVAGNSRQTGKIERLQFRQLVGIESRTREVSHMTGKVAQRAVRIENTRFFVTRNAVTQKLHILNP